MPETAKAVMPDPMAKWSPVPDWTTATIDRAGWSARPVFGLSIAFVGGYVAAALAALAPDMQVLGLWQIAAGPDYAIRIARDRALIVTREPLTFKTGWDTGGWSVTEAESAYGVIDLSGEALADIVSEATAADIETGSRSASVLFAGVPCLLIRMSETTARLHMEIGYMPYLWRWLETRS